MSRFSILLCLYAAALVISCSPAAPDAGPDSQTASPQATAAKPEPTPAPVKRVTPPLGAPAVPGKDERAPDKFSVKLETTKGDILVDVDRAWAPLGADRFYTLVKSGYYTDVAFFRVIAGFMAQVGIHGDPAVNANWRGNRIQDDPVTQRNTQGMLSFAMGGPNSRTTQFFISFGDNTKLDSMGFAPFAKVRDMEVVNKINAEYGEGAPRGMGPSQGLVQTQGNAYLKAKFPNLDYIKSASIIQ